MRAPLVLSFRSAPEGGEVRARPELADFYARWTKGRLVLLIHGYNCPMPDAERAYEGFFARQGELAAHAPGGDFAPDRDFVEVFWKGDDWLGALYYGSAISDAVASAAALADVLRALSLERAEGLEVQVVAHSLGTRLTLELLRALGPAARVRFTRIVFFAAATPTFMLADPREAHGLRKAYDEALREGLLSLFSGADSVLALAFPAGQTFAGGGEGVFPVALGHAYWSLAPASTAQQENRNAGHGDYWGGDQAKPDCERFAGSMARDYLGFTGAGDRPVLAAATAARRPGAARPAPGRTLAARETASRDLG